MLINSDLGEIQEQFDSGAIFTILDNIDLANISCNAHAGNENLIQETIKLCLLNNVKVGAHPSYPDRENFGRKSLKMSQEEFKREMIKQVSFISEILKNQHTPLHHIKAHGALYNDMMTDLILFELFINVLSRHFNFQYIIVQALPDLTNHYSIAEKYKVKLLPEAFCDRRYHSSGLLVPRKNSLAVIEKEDEIKSQFLDIVMKNCVNTIDGISLKIHAKTICLHGDSKNIHSKISFLKTKQYLKFSTERYNEESALFTFQKEIDLNIINYIAKNLLQWKEVKQSIPSFNTLYVEFDNQIDDIVSFINYHLTLSNNIFIKNKLIVIPCYYSLGLCPDLEELLQKLNFTLSEFIHIHADQKYKVCATGFRPGFAYLGFISKKIHTPRKKKPRYNVKKGSVAIANDLTAVYPVETSGGWNIVGLTPLNINESTFNVGDEVIFKSISHSEFLALGGTIE